eukprot:TRINITY_DN30007_c0_g1_i1.p1 TRINITY_DN30007_c0_g1~~TRINITY_DN30007_c0_g1_i1.p1  ORF type:complete len:1058 (+),score=238.73 TRINITY_DN30007_c0_g1_i1:234-3407(+)
MSLPRPAREENYELEDTSPLADSHIDQQFGGLLLPVENPTSQRSSLLGGSSPSPPHRKAPDLSEFLPLQADGELFGARGAGLGMGAATVRHILTGRMWTSRKHSQVVEVTPRDTVLFYSASGNPLPPARLLTITERTVLGDGETDSLGPSHTSGRSLGPAVPEPAMLLGSRNRGFNKAFQRHDGSFGSSKMVLPKRTTDVMLLGAHLESLTDAEGRWSDGDVWTPSSDSNAPSPQEDALLSKTVNSMSSATAKTPLLLDVTCQRLEANLDATFQREGALYRTGGACDDSIAQGVGDNADRHHRGSMYHRPMETEMDSPLHYKPPPRPSPLGESQVAEPAQVSPGVSTKDNRKAAAPSWFQRLCCCAAPVGVDTPAEKRGPYEQADMAVHADLIAMVTPTLEAYLSGTENCETLDERSCAELAVMLVLALGRMDASIPPGHRIDIVAHCSDNCMKTMRTPAAMQKVLVELREQHAETEPELNGGAQSRVDIINHWWSVDKDGSGSLDHTELQELMQRLNTNISQTHLMEKLKEFDSDGNMQLDFFEFVRFYYALQRREGITRHIEKVHNKFFEAGSGGLLVDTLKFLQEIQREVDFEEVEAQNEIEAWFGKWYTLPVKWEVSDFAKYLCSSRNSWFNPRKKRLHSSDMTYSMCHYFINSSHNTYLTGHQLHSFASAEMYKSALLTGVRCIEIDAWVKDGHLVVTHGNTLVRNVPLDDVLRTIRKYAFKKSKYPLIISIENKVKTADMQEEMARQFIKYLGSNNLVCDLDKLRAHDTRFTPEALKGKFLLRSRDSNCVRSMQKLLAFVSGSIGDADISKELSVLRLPSLNNQVAKEKGLADPVYIKQLTKKRLIRVYPMGHYVNSENFSPVAIWASGFQMCCMNIQTIDEHMSINSAMFRQNGSVGYVLKPEYLRGDTPNRPKRLAISVIGGGNLPKPQREKRDIIDPYVELKIVGSPEDTAKPVRTAAVEDNGLDPLWKEDFQFNLRYPESAFVIITVFDQERHTKNRFVAEAVCPFSSLRQGFRSIPLFAKDGAAFQTAFLFVEIKISNLIPKKTKS